MKNPNQCGHCGNDEIKQGFNRCNKCGARYGYKHVTQLRDTKLFGILALLGFVSVIFSASIRNDVILFFGVIFGAVFSFFSLKSLIHIMRGKRWWL